MVALDGPQRKYSTYGRPAKLQKGTSKMQMIKMAQKIGIGRNKGRKREDETEEQVYDITR